MVERCSKYCRECITNSLDKTKEIKLEYPAAFKSRQKGARGKWETLKEI